MVGEYFIPNNDFFIIGAIFSNHAALLVNSCAPFSLTNAFESQRGVFVIFNQESYGFVRLPLYIGC